MREYHRDYYHRRRQAMIEFLGGECVECGSTENLEFDHIDPSQKLFDISQNLTLSNPDVLTELGKCQLLCQPHHQAKTAAGNSGFTHGTIYGFQNKKCRCGACWEAEQEYRAVRNANRRSSDGRGPYRKNWPCGTIGAYRKGCKCDRCRAANAAQRKLNRSSSTTQI